MKGEIHSQLRVRNIANELVAEFQPLMQIEGKILNCEIESDICIEGNAEQLNQLISILLENAIKYSTENANINFDLRTDKKNLNLVVSNESSEIGKEKIRHLFDRFYRTDKSRSRESGGYGLGLSIAKSIVKNHRGKISAQYADGWTCFSVSLPLA
jgi:two-component system, OmpR family, sensor histidine kinase CiaH